MLNYALYQAGALYTAKGFHYLFFIILNIVLLIYGGILLSQGVEEVFNPRLRGMNKLNPIIKVENLKAVYLVREGTIKAADGISFEVPENSVTAIVGESASGKSTIIEAMTKTLPPNGRILSGKVLYNGKDILTLSNEELRKIKWKEIALVPQAAQQSLNPTMKIIDHFKDTVEAHRVNWSHNELIKKLQKN